MNCDERLYGTIDFNLLNSQAKTNYRLRQHQNIHENFSDPCQRLFVSMQLRSYVIPHRHTSPAKSETFIVLRGCIGLLFFDEHGHISNAVKIGPDCANQVCDIPPGKWHTAIALEADSVFLEVKPGPYTPIEEVDMANWAPQYGSPDIEAYLESLYTHFE